MTVAIEIDLKTIQNVQSFVKEMEELDAEADLISGKYIINAKSILGIYSLDLAQPLILRINSEKELNLSFLEKYKVNK